MNAHSKEPSAVVGTVDLAVVEQPLELLTRDVGEGRQRAEAVDHGFALDSTRDVRGHYLHREVGYLIVRSIEIIGEAAKKVVG